MKRFSSPDEIWDFAIAKETEAHDFYKKLARWAERPKVAEAFEELALVELRHRIRLEALKAGEIEIQADEVGNLGIADSIGPIKLRANLTYAGALLLAMQREKQAFRFYTHLAAMTQDPQAKSILMKLAQEEAEHRLRLEVEYDLTTF